MNLQQQQQAEKECKVFNERYPIGTEVTYWPGVKRGEGIVSKTRTEAKVISCSSGVWVEGESSCISLTHVDPVNQSLR